MLFINAADRAAFPFGLCRPCGQCSLFIQTTAAISLVPLAELQTATHWFGCYLRAIMQQHIWAMLGSKLLLIPGGSWLKTCSSPIQTQPTWLVLTKQHQRVCRSIFLNKVRVQIHPLKSPATHVRANLTWVSAAFFNILIWLIWKHCSAKSFFQYIKKTATMIESQHISVILIGNIIWSQIHFLENCCSKLVVNKCNLYEAGLRDSSLILGFTDREYWGSMPYWQ